MSANRSGIIGHAPTLDFLESSWEKGRLAHAYLIVGPPGSGKVRIARWLAGLVLGSDTLETNPDFTFVERGENPKTGKLQNAIVIDQVHALCGRISLGSMLGGWKVAVLDGADRLNDAAGNAILKTLEEPHSKTLIVLTAGSLDSVMPTIASRCQIVRLSRVPRQEIADRLVSLRVDRSRADLSARLSGGCPGIALSVATDDGALVELRERRNSLMTLVESGLTERWRGLEDLVSGGTSFNEARDSLEETLGLLAELLRDAVLVGQGLEERMVHADERERLGGWVRNFGLDRLNAALNETDSSRRMLSTNVSPKTVVGLVAGSLSGL